MPSTKEKDVYFMEVKEMNAVRIGTSNNLQERLKQIQRGVPCNVEIIGVIKEGGEKTEDKIHKQFEQLHLHGDWFTMSNEIKDYIKEANNNDKEITNINNDLTKRWSETDDSVFFCLGCDRWHYKTSKIGRSHWKLRRRENKKEESK